MYYIRGVLLVLFSSIFFVESVSADIWDEAERGFAKNGDIDIHYASIARDALELLSCLRVWVCVCKRRELVPKGTIAGNSL